MSEAIEAPADPEVADVEVMQRGDSGHKAKTTMPRIAGGYKLPPSEPVRCSVPTSSSKSTPTNSNSWRKVLTEKYAEFEIHGQITQINPGPVVTTFEFKPEAGIKYSRITNLCDDPVVFMR